MRKIVFYTLSTLTTALALLAGCSKNISGRTDNIAQLNPANTDIDAGSWKPVLLSRPDTFAVLAPAATNSPAYTAELNEIKSAQQDITDARKAIIKYWSAGAVLRWNEILRTLVAKYNLPPYQNADGSYPIPSSLYPFAYPQFPFSNPPYAARAFAYVSAAEYDALVAAWYYKKLYNRSAPYKVDSSVNALIPRSELPSYPSEDAVLAGTMAEMMKALFPTELDFIQQKVDEAENYRIWSGANVRSDIVAGEALGRQVAAVFMARAKADNAGKAVGTPDQWLGLETQTAAKGQTPWFSLEVPKRNPMLPFFGNVKAFLFDSATCVMLRPGPPPSTNSDEMKKETAETHSYITNPSREQMRIVQYWADGIGTYTPPGHWNAIAAEDFVTKNFSEVRWARNMALLNMAIMDAGIVCWNTKYYYYNPRPTQMDSSIKTLTGIPNFPSYISGHATFSGAAATILAHIIPEKADTYMAMATQASMSRLYAGIHFPIDCSTGLTVGQHVGSYAVKRAQSDGAE
ncbi:MAG TPA: phosphatase PAP2 family protein [Chitinophagaceae bacterium]|nr:phosphatase PAP2 family protein [Chitinophagaceae bacterium]